MLCELSSELPWHGSSNKEPQHATLFGKNLKFLTVKYWSYLDHCLTLFVFPGDKPTYAEIAEWRKILGRLASFLRSIDYLILEMLRRLVVTATRHLLEHLVSAYNVTEEEEEKVILYCLCVWIHLQGRSL